MHIPSWFRSILPKAALRVEEESWNAYPYTRTRWGPQEGHLCTPQGGSVSDYAKGCSTLFYLKNTNVLCIGVHTFGSTHSPSACLGDIWNIACIRYEIARILWSRSSWWASVKAYRKIMTCERVVRILHHQNSVWPAAAGLWWALPLMACLSVGGPDTHTEIWEGAEQRCALDCIVGILIDCEGLLTHLFNQWQLCFRHLGCNRWARLTHFLSAVRGYILMM